MGALDFMRDRPTLQEMRAKPVACPKGASRMDLKAEKYKDTESDLDQAKADVWKRDKNSCRCCGRKVIKSLAAVPNRGEVNHLAARSKVKVLLVDLRNLILMCLRCHQRFTGKVNDRIFAVQKAADMFVLEGRSFVNAEKPVTFEEMAK